MYTAALELIDNATNITVIQAENPDGDSLGSSLALEEILADLGKTVQLYCPVDIPKYLRYMAGWDRVVSDFPTDADLFIIVDTSADMLLTKTLHVVGVRSQFEHKPVLVIDHHASTPTLSFPHTFIGDSTAVSTGEVLYRMAHAARWAINKTAAESLLSSIMSDTLGFITPNVTPSAHATAAKLIELGAVPAEIDSRRKSFMKKSPVILAYKGRLIGRIEYAVGGRLATVHIPWEEIQAYSDQYNPSMLVIEEMMFVEGVDACVAIKTYPDGKLTGKVRAVLPVADRIAGFFGGGGHAYSAGFKVYERYDTIVHELLKAASDILEDYDHDHQTT